MKMFGPRVKVPLFVLTVSPTTAQACNLLAVDAGREKIFECFQKQASARLRRCSMLTIVSPLQSNRVPSATVSFLVANVIDVAAPVITNMDGWSCISASGPQNMHSSEVTFHLKPKLIIASVSSCDMILNLSTELANRETLSAESRCVNLRWLSSVSVRGKPNPRSCQLLIRGSSLNSIIPLKTSGVSMPPCLPPIYKGNVSDFPAP